MKKIIEREKQDLIYLKWHDAHSSGGWHSPEQTQKFLDNEICIVEDAGWLFYEDDKEICLCSRRIVWGKKTISHEDEFGMLQKIPKSWILERKILMPHAAA